MIRRNLTGVNYDDWWPLDIEELQAKYKEDRKEWTNLTNVGLPREIVEWLNDNDEVDAFVKNGFIWFSEKRMVLLFKLTW